MGRNRFTIRSHREFFDRLNNGRDGVVPQCTDEAIIEQRLYRAGVSQISQEWLAAIERKHSIQLLRGDVEYQIPGTPLLVDGFDPASNTIYEFYGDYWHGNPLVYKPDQYNTSVGRTFGFLYRRTVARERQLRKLGYRVISVWEYDWLHKKVDI